MKERKIIKTTILKVMLLMALIFTLGVYPVYASSMVLIGKDVGLEVIPKDNNLFKVTNMSPGDYLESKLTIKNDYQSAFELFMKGEGQTDSTSLLISVKLRDREIFKGYMTDFAKGNGISLGKFQPGDVEEMLVSVFLPGKDTGNEFQGKTLDTKWTFTAISDGEIDIPEEPVPGGEAKLPKTGFGINSNLYTFLGLFMICSGIFGICVFRRDRRIKYKKKL